MKTLFIIACFLFASPSWAAVSYVTSATATETGQDTSISLTIDAGAGSNRLLVCAMHFTAVANTITGITHNSVALTQSAVGKISLSDYSVDVWYLKAPASGSQTVTATVSGTGSNKILTCMAFAGVDQTTPFGTGASFAATTDPATATVTVPANGMGVAFNTNNDQANAGSYTVDANSTKRFELADTDGNIAAIGSTTATAGSNAQTVSNPLTEYSVLIALPINAAAVVTQRPIGAIVFQ